MPYTVALDASSRGDVEKEMMMDQGEGEDDDGGSAAAVDTTQLETIVLHAITDTCSHLLYHVRALELLPASAARQQH